MFFAHLPAGYLTARLYCQLFRKKAQPVLVLVGMAGGIFPDIDLVYGALIHGGEIHHHRYWTHLPVFWLCVQALAVFWPGSVTRSYLSVFLVGVWSHMLLDSIAGDIWWLWPWIDHPYSLTHIPALHTPWWLNYLLHWTFLAELAIVALAVWVEKAKPVFPLQLWKPT